MSRSRINKVAEGDLTTGINNQDIIIVLARAPRLRAGMHFTRGCNRVPARQMTDEVRMAIAADPYMAIK